MIKRVLIVESSKIVANQYRNFLDKLDFLETEICGDGHEALGRLLAQNYDALVVSSNSKTIKGVDLLAIVRMIENANQKIPNILIYRESDDFNEGCADYTLADSRNLIPDLELILMKIFKEEAQKIGPPPIPR